MKEKTMANSEQYKAVVEDLMKQKTELQFKVGEIDAALAALRRLMPAENAAPVKASQQNLPITGAGRYSGMSVRWAVLALLSEHAVAPLSTGEIATTLLENGVTSEGRSFGANVSAVLSKMNHERKEIESVGGRWIISAVGKQSWMHVKASRERHLQRFDSSPNATSLLSEQSPHAAAA